LEEGKENKDNEEEHGLIYDDDEENEVSLSLTSFFLKSDDEVEDLLPDEECALEFDKSFSESGKCVSG